MKSIKYFLAIIIICIFNFTNSYSQKNFKTGYVVDIQKDTIKGLIDYQNWDKTPKAIVFKTVSDSKETIYTPNNIQSFSVAGERYISGIVTIDESAYRDNELSESEKPRYKTEKVFLQILINGEKTLYYLKDENLKVHFFIGQNGIYETLVFIKYLNNIGGDSFIQTKEIFKGQLNIYLQDCPSIQKKISNVSYSKDDLTRLFKEYYKCTQKEILYQPELEKIKAEVGILAGLSLTKLKFIGTDDYFISLINTEYPWAKNFTAGGFINIVLPRKKGKWSINNELMFTSYKVSGMNKDSYNTNIYTNTYSSIGYSYFTINNLLKLKFPVNKIFLYINGGFSNGITISETNYLRVESHVYSVNSISESKLNNARKWERGLLLGLGSDFRNLSIELRFERSDGMSSYLELTSPVIRCFCILGYKF